MTEADPNVRVVERKASDNEYLHRDFHGAMCYIVRHLDDTYGTDATEEYLRQLGATVYQPLSDQLRAEGLAALEMHWRRVFDKEGGEYDLAYDGDIQVLTVAECPAVSHLRKRDQLLTERFCETTVIVNEAICAAAGYACSCEYVPGAGHCVQKFWRDGG